MTHHLFPIIGAQDLDSLPVIVLMYESGSSGEFLASAITHSFDGFYRAPYQWENDWRCVFHDAFGKELSCGHHVINHDLLLRKFNSVLVASRDVDRHFMVTAHPRPESSLAFVTKYLPSRPMIKIICRSQLSKQFRKLSCFYKLNHWDRDINRRLDLLDEQIWVDQISNPCIDIEWRDMILDHPRREFNRLEEFLGISGDWLIFSDLINDYVRRNHEILQQIQIDQ